jgi:hypothetical protein
MKQGWDQNQAAHEMLRIPGRRIWQRILSSRWRRFPVQRMFSSSEFAQFSHSGFGSTGRPFLRFTAVPIKESFELNWKPLKFRDGNFFLRWVRLFEMISILFGQV